MKLGLFWRLFRLHHSHRLLLLSGSDLVFPSLPLRLMLVVLLLNKSSGGIVNSCFVSLRLITSSIPGRGTAITGRVVRACLAVSCRLRASAGIRVGDGGRLRRVRLCWMSFRNNWCGAYRCRINTCSWCWICRFGCPSGVLTIVSTLSALNIGRRLLWIIRRFGFVRFSVVVLSRAMMLISAMRRLIWSICRWRRRWSVLLSCCVAVSASLRGRTLLSISRRAGRIWRLNNLPRCLSLLRNVMSPSRSRSLNSVTSSSLGCSITCLYRRILSLCKTLGVLTSRRVSVVVTRGHVGWKGKKARVKEDVKPASAMRSVGGGLDFILLKTRLSDVMTSPSHVLKGLLWKQRESGRKKYEF